VITHDPLTLRVGAKDLFVDIGAERFLGAEQGGRRIAVEVKSFVGGSEVRELEVALGLFVLYGDALALVEPDAGARIRTAAPDTVEADQ
jgi:hypothetical protein